MNHSSLGLNTEPNMKAFNILQHHKPINITNVHFIVHYKKKPHKISAAVVNRFSIQLRFHFLGQTLQCLKLEALKKNNFNRNPHPAQIIKHQQKQVQMIH